MPSKMDEALMTTEDAERVRELIFEKALDLGMTDVEANKLDRTFKFLIKERETYA